MWRFILSDNEGWSVVETQNEIRSVLGGAFGGNGYGRSSWNAGRTEDGECVELWNQAEAGGLREIFVEALEIFCVEGIVDVGAQVERKFFFGELKFTGGFGTDFWKMSEAVGE